MGDPLERAHYPSKLQADHDGGAWLIRWRQGWPRLQGGQVVCVSSTIVRDLKCRPSCLP